jgi:hypothetical protein
MMPVPDSAATAVPPMVAVRDNEAVMLPVLLGANDTASEHVAPAASAPVQVVVWILKSVGSLSVSDSSEVVEPPAFATVKDAAALVFPTVVVGKVRLEGEMNSSAGAMPTPVSARLAVPPVFAWADKVAVRAP